jgi:hypothetical protein
MWNNYSNYTHAEMEANEIKPHTAVWMGQTNILLSEKSQAEEYLP